MGDKEKGIAVSDADAPRREQCVVCRFWQPWTEGALYGPCSALHTHTSYAANCAQFEQAPPFIVGQARDAR